MIVMTLVLFPAASQEELDQLHFEHQVLSEEASRLREAMIGHDWP